MPIPSSEKLFLFNVLTSLKLHAIATDVSRILAKDANGHKNYFENICFSLSITIDTIEHHLKLLKLSQKYAIEEYRKINNLD